MDNFEWVSLSQLKTNRSRGASSIFRAKDILLILVLLGMGIPFAVGLAYDSNAPEEDDQALSCRENQALLIPNHLLKIEGKSRAGDVIRKKSGNGNIVLSAEGNIFYFPKKNFKGEDHLVFEFCRDKNCFEKEILFEVEKENPFKFRKISPPKEILVGEEAFEVKELKHMKNPVSLQVFNRWGNCVLTAEDYRLSNDWKGTHSETGRNLAAGKYFYVFSTGKKFKKGFLQIVEQKS